MDNTLFIVVPVLNVDGYVYTWEIDRLWHKNRRQNGDGSFGVDLNRNWGNYLQPDSDYFSYFCPAS
jgi:murein tripeptide amidase MpaA